jgi:hypothetical protein
MRKHINLLGVLYLVWGALGVLLGLAMFLLAAGASALAYSVAREGMAAGVTAVSLTLFGVLLLAGGATNAWIGHGIRRHRGLARLFGLAFALLNLFLFPFGTALGIYSFWVLLSNGGRQLFEGDV